MSRTRRYHRKTGRVMRDGFRSGRTDPTCERHGSCAYCEMGRQHVHLRRQPADVFRMAFPTHPSTLD
jgi:hypothetical protein